MASATSNSWRGGGGGTGGTGGGNRSSSTSNNERGGSSSGRSRGRGRGGGGGGGGGDNGIKRDISNMSWKRPITNQEDKSTTNSSESIMLGGSPSSSFGTPTFKDGQSNDLFGGGDPTSFGTPAFIGGGGFRAGNALERTSDLDSIHSTSFTPPLLPSITPSNQISTLEVLGEDSDSRKKRFESTLANNRYLELKPLREIQRLSDIKRGIIPDPLKPRRLDEAMDFLGTCQDMCPEWEREEREYQKAVDAWERYPGTNRIDPTRAVKAFHRPAAGNDQPLPSDVRPPHILKKTLDYLFHELLPSQPLHLTHPFLRDRTRAVRQDFTMQNDRGALAIECNERIARYHVLALGTLRDVSTFSESQELEQLRKVLKSLNEFYDDARLCNPPLPTPNEAEFRAYNLLTHIRDPDIIWSTELLPLSVFNHPLLQIALSLHSLVQRSNIGRGERASPNGFSRFFKLVSTNQVPYLFACLLSSHFGEIRKNALDTLKKAYFAQHSWFPVKTLAKILGCDDEDEAVEICETVGLEVKVGEGGKVLVGLHKVVKLNASLPKARVSKRLVEAKRGNISYQSIIDSTSPIACPVSPLPSTPAMVSSPQFRRSSQNLPLAFSVPPPTSFDPISAQTGRTIGLGFPSAFTINQQASSAFEPVPTQQQDNIFAPKPIFPPSAISTPSFSTFVTPIPTPISTPPPPQSTSLSQPLPNLSATAAAFTPSTFTPSAFIPTAPSIFSQPPPPLITVAPSPLFPSFTSVPISASTPAFIPQPIPTPTFTPQSKPTFQFTPPPHPPSLPSVSQQPIQTKPLFVPTLPVNTSVSIVPPPLPAVIKSGFPSTAKPLISSPLRRIVSTSSTATPLISRSKLNLSRSTGNNSAIRKVSLSSPLHGQDRELMLNRFIKLLTHDLIKQSLITPILKISEYALMERWESIKILEIELRNNFVEIEMRNLMDWLIDQLVQVGSLEICFEVLKERELMREVLKNWRERTKESIRKGERELERRKRFEIVSKEIGLGPLDPGEVLLEELNFEGLSLGNKVQSLDVDMSDRKMVKSLRKAQSTRSLLWAPGTFLDIISQQVDIAFGSQHTPNSNSKRASWSCLILTSSTTTSFASWLACKFDLDGEDLNAVMDTTFADVEVRMIDTIEKDDLVLDDVGLLIFDCTMSQIDTATPSAWSLAQKRLDAQISEIKKYSTYDPSLLVILCSDLTLEKEAEVALRTKVSNSLELEKFALKSCSTLIIKLEDAESQFEIEMEKSLTTILPLPGRVLQPISLFVLPLLKLWNSALLVSLPTTGNVSSATLIVLFKIFIEALDTILLKTRILALPTLPGSAKKLPQLPTNNLSFRANLQAYVELPLFEGVSILQGAFSARPPLSDSVLARLTLEHLAEVVASTFEGLEIRQEVLNSNLIPTLSEVESQLQVGENLSLLEERKEKEKQKKRKASYNQVEINNAQTKKIRDSPDLNSLSRLMMEAKALLS